MGLTGKIGGGKNAIMGKKGVMHGINEMNGERM